MALADNYRRWVAKFTQGVEIFQAELGSAFVGVLCGLLPDILADGASRAVRSPWMTLADQPEDALALIGMERKLPRYSTETTDQYRARLRNAWHAYSFGGDESSILDQLALAGHPGAVIYDPGNLPTIEPVGYWSQFIVVFPIGTHTVTAPAPLWGSFNWGDVGVTYGPVGLTHEDDATTRAIIRKWKPVQWVCRARVYQISGWFWGDGHVFGQAALTWGGVTVST